jgi:hypothetical protein
VCISSFCSRKPACCGLFGKEATSVFWSVALDADLLRFGAGASIDSETDFRPLLLQIQIMRPNNNRIDATTPRPTPTAASVLICDVGPRVEPSPNGAPSNAASHAPLEHILLPAHCLSGEQVVVGWAEDAVKTATSSGGSCAVALGVGVEVSSCIELDELDCLCMLLERNVCCDDTPSVTDCLRELVCVVCASRRVLAVVVSDIMY